MASKVLILDTSILCCWLKIPGKDTAGPTTDKWDYQRIDTLLKAEIAKGSTLVLPIASLIETGNHIAQCGGDRFQLATRLTEHLKNATNAKSPWAAFNDQAVLWEAVGLTKLSNDWPHLAISGLTIGDATIKFVAEHYASSGFPVEILTGDKGLKAYEPIHAAPIPRRRS
jgi:hypothetical protein